MVLRRRIAGGNTTEREFDGERIARRDVVYPVMPGQTSTEFTALPPADCEEALTAYAREQFGDQAEKSPAWMVFGDRPQPERWPMTPLEEFLLRWYMEH